MKEGSDTIAFIPKHMVPKYKMPTYDRLVCGIREHKAETHCTRVTVSGNLIDLPGDRNAATVDLTTIKYHLNSIISERGARFSTTDIKNFYFGPPLAEFDYMKLKLGIILNKIIQQYNHRRIAHDGWVYI